MPAASVELLEREGRSAPPQSGPWPGRLPPPSPARSAALVPASVVDERGHTVAVSGGDGERGPPLAIGHHGQAGSPPGHAWAGPWPVEERWWDPLTRRRRARFQLVTEDGQAHLVVLAEGRWWLAATYD